ncbi:hypothetical protein NFHSH190041_10440 [Shewanella sp. NFH-SH190041]|uniref:DUF6776 family protein n=1 Tax=Shewanella sp. NFH-SH190041 TaxID=2950245 RepID=UPI0021C31DAD|nr:DUF6776 family protein [Shewanella sp. NFH-SH190041]BDM63592.1 hypothetical protein NFHSH190041_10440 [Shewanella sp. NFH-SH190041]
MLRVNRWLSRLYGSERRYRASNTYLVLLTLVAFILGILAYHTWLDWRPMSPDNQQQLIDSLQADLQDRAGELASRNLELEVAKNANSDMKKLFAEQLQREKKLQRELTFYRSVMAPEHAAAGVAINGVELMPGLLKGQQRIELVLMQLDKRKEPIKGRVDIRLIGSRHNKVKTLSLEKLTDQELKFSFRYFQMLDSEFTLPKDFKLARVDVKVIVPATRWNEGAESQQTFSVPAITAGGQEPRVILEQNGQVTDNPAQ